MTPFSPSTHPMIWFGLVAAFGALVAGGAAGNSQLQDEWARWVAKSHPTLQRDSSEGLPNSPKAPLRVPKPGGKPLWMKDETPDEEVDPRLKDVLVFNPALDNNERKATHWTLNDTAGPLHDGAGNSRGDGGA